MGRPRKLLPKLEKLPPPREGPRLPTKIKSPRELERSMPVKVKKPLNLARKLVPARKLTRTNKIRNKSQLPNQRVVLPKKLPRPRLVERLPVEPKSRELQPRSIENLRVLRNETAKLKLSLLKT